MCFINGVLHVLDLLHVTFRNLELTIKETKDSCSVSEIPKYLSAEAVEPICF
jgi:hypothetical protein